MLFRNEAAFDLAVRLRGADSVTLGEVFAFVSALYFRGKLSYARHFARPGDEIRIITSTRGLVHPETPVVLADLQEMAAGSIDEAHAPYRAAVIRDAIALDAALDRTSPAILLGSIATEKYVGTVGHVFGDRLVFPEMFVGRGDMSRGGLLLRAISGNTELAYAAIHESVRRGVRPDRLPRVRATKEDK